jgi:hypothetical protein
MAVTLKRLASFNLDTTGTSGSVVISPAVGANTTWQISVITLSLIVSNGSNFTWRLHHRAGGVDGGNKDRIRGENYSGSTPLLVGNYDFGHGMVMQANDTLFLSFTNSTGATSGGIAVNVYGAEITP